MKKLTTVALSAMLLLGLGVTTLSADGHMKKDDKMMKTEKCGAGKCGADSKKDMGSMKKDDKMMKDEKCGAGKCGADSKKDMGSMKKDM